MELFREGSIMNKMIRMLGVGAVALGTVLPIGAARADTAPYCGIRWGSLAKQGSAATAGPVGLTNVRAGRHACYDRLVLDGGSWEGVRYGGEVREDPARRGARPPSHDRLVLDGASWARVRYVGQVREDPSGRVVPLRGGAKLEIV